MSPGTALKSTIHKNGMAPATLRFLKQKSALVLRLLTAEGFSPLTENNAEEGEETKNWWNRANIRMCQQS